MADLFKKKNAELAEAPVAADANAPEMAPAEKKAKKEKKNKQQFLEPNKMNFKEQYEIVVEGKKKNLDLAKILKPLVAVLVVVLAIFVVLEVVLLGMKAQTKSLNNYINDTNNIATYNEAVETKTMIDTVNLQKSNLEACIDAIKTYPTINADFFKKVADVATKNGVTITSYSYTNSIGYLTLSCKATAISPNTTGISQFIRDLDALGVFYSYEYRSFSGTLTDGYGFDVSFTCNGNGENVIQSAVVDEPVAEEVTE